MSKWTHQLFGSGTQTVSLEPYTPKQPHYHIGHAAADNDGQHLRYEIAKELEAWLNGGPEPWWMELLHRESPDSVKTPHGSSIRATGPMIDKAEPPSWGMWAEDESDDAKISRGLLIDALMNREQPAHPKP